MAGTARRVAGAGVLALALGAATADAARAQGRWLPDAGFFALGVSGIATGELDDHLAARGYPTFGRTALAPSIGAYWSLPGGVLLGGELHGVILGQEAHEGEEVGLGGGYATLGAAYAVELSPRARVYPRLGLGVGGLGLWTESEDDPVGFDEALAGARPDADDDAVLNRTSVVVDLGAGAEILPFGRGRGLLVGLRVGYLAAAFTSDWQLDGDRTVHPVTGGPAASVAGPYARVVVGWRRR